ncbi:MAG: hypothetical protein RLZZ70_136 [Candidatus Parcubacteria bacterium]|jgi:hypothetical protein
MIKRVVRVSETDGQERDGYVYRRLVSQDTNPYNCLYIKVHGAHKPRRVLFGIRNYYVVSGSGIFVVQDEEIQVEKGFLVVIKPAEVYSYTGVMELLEFNIPTEGKIAHKDIIIEQEKF